MHIKCLRRGRGSARAAVDYLVGERDAEGHRREGVEVLRGNPQPDLSRQHGRVSVLHDVGCVASLCRGRRDAPKSLTKTAARGSPYPHHNPSAGRARGSA